MNTEHDELDDQYEPDDGPRSIFSVMWFRALLVILALGLVGTLALTRVLASFLFDMQPWDPPTLLGVAAILLLVCAAACLAPARRATAVDPVRVLQAE